MPVLDVEGIERDAILLEPAQQASYLRERIGQELTAFACGLKDAQTIAEWISDPERRPRDKARMRLGYAYVCTRLLSEAYGPDTAQRWLIGANSRLGIAPILMLRHAESPEDLREVVPVATAFAGPGR